MSNSFKRRKAILYTRISNSEIFAHDLGFSNQIFHQKKYCQRYNIEVVDIFYELSEGNTFEREEYKNITEKIRKWELEIDFFICYSWDRFSIDRHQIQWEVSKLNEMGIHVKVVKHFLTDDKILQKIKNLKKGK
jgi:DNA invertase Pin-like site-specific DNA recombinase